MEFSKFATMVQAHGCAPQTSVEFTCKCTVNFSTEMFALPFAIEEHLCPYMTSSEEIPKLPANPLPAKKKAKESDAESVASSKSNKSNISAISDGMIDDHKFYCLEPGCKTPKLKRFKSFQKEITWRLHMYQVTNYY